jgi:hypothetical protein
MAYFMNLLPDGVLPGALCGAMRDDSKAMRHSATTLLGIANRPERLSSRRDKVKGRCAQAPPSARELDGDGDESDRDRNMNMNMNKLNVKGGLWAAAVALAGIWPAWAGAAAFSADSVVVYRVGAGSATLNGNATAVFLDEYSPAGVLRQSIAMPTAPTAALSAVTASGDASVEGRLSLSADGSTLVVPGYSALLGGSTAGANPSTTPRVIALVDAQGGVTTQSVTALPSRVYGAVSADGVSGYLFGSSGVAYVDGAGHSNKILNGQTSDMAIVDGQLFYTFNGTTPGGIYAMDHGLPTSGLQTGQLLATVGDPRGFTFADLSGAVAGVDTMYVSDLNAGQSVISKFSKQANGEWAYRQSLPFGTFDLSSRVVGGQVQIFGTVSTGLLALTDTSGYDGVISGSVTTLATAAPKTAFRGVALAPISVVPEASGLSLALAGALCCLGLRFTASTNSAPRARAAGGSAPADAARP